MRTTLIPFGRDWLPGRSDDPFASFRREMDRVFGDTFGRNALSINTHSGGLTPRLDVAETDEAVTITVELPGVEEEDVELTLERGLLTIKGEKKIETGTEESGRRVVERTYGRFSRSLRLPSEIEQDRAEAQFDKGVLTVTLPKPAAAKADHRRIEIKTAG